MIRVQQRVQIDRDDRPHIELSQVAVRVRLVEADLTRPSRRVVPSGFSSRGEFRPEILSFGLVQGGLGAKGGLVVLDVPLKFGLVPLYIPEDQILTSGLGAVLLTAKCATEWV